MAAPKETKRPPGGDGARIITPMQTASRREPGGRSGCPRRTAFAIAMTRGSRQLERAPQRFYRLPNRASQQDAGEPHVESRAVSSEACRCGYPCAHLLLL